MKKTEILKQSYELTNDFNNDAMFAGLKSQIADKVFKELINGEKDSLTVEFRVFVNEQEEDDKDPNLVKAMEIVKLARRLKLDKLMETEQLKNDYGVFMDLFDLWQKAGNIDTSKF